VCSSGKKALGGGYYMNVNYSQGVAPIAVKSYPSDDSSWSVTVHPNGYSGGFWLLAYVVCATVNADP
jgi:hypothetical protein